MKMKNSVSRLSQHGILKIPNSWIQSRVKYLGDYINGYPFKPSDWSSYGRPILRIQNLNSPATEANRYEGELPPRYLVKNGDLLISWSASLGIFKWQTNRFGIRNNFPPTIGCNGSKKPETKNVYNCFRSAYRTQ